MNKRIILKSIVILLVLVLAAIFIYRNKDDILEIKIENPIYLIPLVVLSIAFLGVNGLINKVMLKIFNVDLSVKEWFGLSAVNTMGNNIFPFRGGTISNALYLKKQYEFPFASYVSILSAIYIIVFWVNCFLGVLSLIFIKMYYGDFDLLVLLFFTGGFIFLSLVVLFAPKFSLTKFGIINKFIEVINGWHELSKHKKVLFQLFILSVVAILILSAMTYVEFLIIGKEVPFTKLLLLSVFSSFSLFISITPGNLGIREAFSVYSGTLVGLPTAQIIVVSVIDRVVNFATSLILGLYYSVTLLNKKKQSRKQVL